MFLADFGAYDVQFEGFGGDYVFWAGSAQSEGRRHMHPRIKSPPESNTLLVHNNQYKAVNVCNNVVLHVT